MFGEGERGMLHDAEEEGAHDDDLFGAGDLDGPDDLGGDGEDGEFGQDVDDADADPEGHLCHSVSPIRLDGWKAN